MDDADIAAPPSALRLLTPEAFLARVGEEAARARRHRRPLGVATVLIDGMTMLRKADGIAAAGEVFDFVAETVIEALRGTDRTGRLGPAQLGVLLPETDAEAAAIAAERLRRQVRAQAVPSVAGPRRVTLSIGVAGLTARMADPRTILLAACFELRRAQRAGGDRVCAPDRRDGGAAGVN